VSTVRDWPLGTKLLVGFGVVLLVLVGLSAASFTTTVANQAAAESVLHTVRVIALADETLADLVDMESGYRGFLLSGSEEFLQPFEVGRGEYPQNLAALRQETADRPEQVARWDEIAERAERWQSEVIEPRMAIRRQAPPGAPLPADLSVLVASGEGKRQFDGIRQVFSAAVAEEQRILEARNAQAAATGRALLVTLIGGTALGILLALGVAVLLTRDITGAMGRLAVTAQQVAAGDLSRRIALRRRDEIGATAAAFDRMADQLASTIDELSRQKVELERSNRELQDFASVASHDLQEPLRKVQAFGDRLVARYGAVLPPEGHDYLARMQDAAGRMSTLINDLLQFSRVTTRAQPFVAVNLGEVARRVVADLEVRIAESGGRVEVGDLPTIEADPSQMRQLLQNLIANGLKFHRPGVPPRVTVEAEVVEAPEPNGTAGAGEGLVHLWVTDNGIGFDEKYLDRIFTIFQRLHGRGEYPGTGVGLAVCRKIVERHGGTITARSAPGQGATFMVTLPVGQPSREAMEPALALGAAGRAD
jgi:signal transduction histidine kinase